MINKFDKSIIQKYDSKYLKDICNCNIKLVPEKYIMKMKNALALQSPPVECGCCHSFLGWDMADYAFQSKLQNPLNTLFNVMKGTCLPSCNTICINPDVHFNQFTKENKCFPIKKVYEVLLEISPNAANQLLDMGLVEDVYCQIKEKKMKEALLVYRIKRNKFSMFSNFFMRITRQDCKILVVDFDELCTEELEDCSSNEFGKANFVNLINNMECNFCKTVVPKPSAKIGVWEEFVENQIKNDADVIISVISTSMLNLISTWALNLDSEPCNSLTSNQFSRQDIQRFEENKLDDKVKYQYIMYRKIFMSEKIKIAVIFNGDLLEKVAHFFPLTFVLPKEMKKLLFMLEEIRNN